MVGYRAPGECTPPVALGHRSGDARRPAQDGKSGSCAIPGAYSLNKQDYSTDPFRAHQTPAGFATSRRRGRPQVSSHTTPTATLTLQALSDVPL